MFLDEKEQGEVQQAPAKVLKLSEAIRKGCPLVEENKLYSGCALAAGYVAKTGKNLEDNPAIGGGNSMYLNPVHDAFGVPVKVLERASLMHSRGATREAVSDWLEAKGY